jgi:hypothetical protein
MYQVQKECVCGVKYWPSQKWAHEKCVSNGTVSSANVSSESVLSVSNSTSMDYLRVKEWRKVNKARYLELQREASKKYRAKKKAKGLLNGVSRPEG